MSTPSPNFGFVDSGRSDPYFGRLMEELGIPVASERDPAWEWVLAVEDNVLVLIEADRPELRPLSIDLVGTRRRFKSLPVSKSGPLARSLGRKTKTIIDATAGWGQDAILVRMMGYEVTAVERSPVMAALLADGARRFADYEKKLGPPTVVNDDAIRYMAEQSVDCVYLDPMFPPKRKTTALARRPLRVLRELVGDDDDREQLYEAAWQCARRRVVTKRPVYARPWGNPDQVFEGKMMCYDLYLKDR